MQRPPEVGNQSLVTPLKSSAADSQNLTPAPQASLEAGNESLASTSLQRLRVGWYFVGTLSVASGVFGMGTAFTVDHFLNHPVHYLSPDALIAFVTCFGIEMAAFLAFLVLSYVIWDKTEKSVQQLKTPDSETSKLETPKRQQQQAEKKEKREPSELTDLFVPNNSLVFITLSALMIPIKDHNNDIRVLNTELLSFLKENDVNRICVLYTKQDQFTLPQKQSEQTVYIYSDETKQFEAKEFASVFYQAIGTSCDCHFLEAETTFNISQQYTAYLTQHTETRSFSNIFCVAGKDEELHAISEAPVPPLFENTPLEQRSYTLIKVTPNKDRDIDVNKNLLHYAKYHPQKMKLQSNAITSGTRSSILRSNSIFTSHHKDIQKNHVSDVLDNELCHLSDKTPILIDINLLVLHNTAGNVLPEYYFNEQLIHKLKAQKDNLSIYLVKAPEPNSLRKAMHNVLRLNGMIDEVDLLKKLSDNGLECSHVLSAADLGIDQEKATPGTAFEKYYRVPLDTFKKEIDTGKHYDAPRSRGTPEEQEQYINKELCKQNQINEQTSSQQNVQPLFEQYSTQPLNFLQGSSNTSSSNNPMVQQSQAVLHAFKHSQQLQSAPQIIYLSAHREVLEKVDTEYNAPVEDPLAGSQGMGVTTFRPTLKLIQVTTEQMRENIKKRILTLQAKGVKKTRDETVELKSLQTQQENLPVEKFKLYKSPDLKNEWEQSEEELNNTNVTDEGSSNSSSM